VAATLKSIDYNVAMTFILNNNNDNIVDKSVYIAASMWSVGYYREHIERADKSQCSTSSTNSLMSLQQRLIHQPLFWTSIISMFIALVSMIAVIVMCITCTRPRRLRRASRGRRGNQSGTTSGSEDKKWRLVDENDDDYNKQHLDSDSGKSRLRGTR